MPWGRVWGRKGRSQVVNRLGLWLRVSYVRGWNIERRSGKRWGRDRGRSC